MAEEAPSSTQAAPKRPAPMFVDPILVDGRDAPAEIDDLETARIEDADDGVLFEADTVQEVAEADDSAEVVDAAEPERERDEPDEAEPDGADPEDAADEAAVDEIVADETDPESGADETDADEADAADDSDALVTTDDVEAEVEVDAADSAGETETDEAVDDGAESQVDASDVQTADAPSVDESVADESAVDASPPNEPASPPRASGEVLATADGPTANAWRPAGPGVTPKQPDRDLHFGAATAAGLSTMTPFARVTEAPHRELGGTLLEVEGLTKTFGSTTAVDDVSFHVRKGSFFGIVGPNGAGKTTTLSMVTGMLRPSNGKASVLGIDVWREAAAARAHIGILPDRLRLFDQVTGAQLLYYTGVLRGLSADEASARAASLLEAFEIGASADRLVVDYSAGMTKKIALASSLIHSPELLVLDEPFESIDPVSAGQLTDILFEYVRRGGTVMLSSHSMDLVQRVCDHVAIIVRGEILAEGTVAEVRGDVTLEERFRDIVRGPRQTEGLDWLGISFS